MLFEEVTGLEEVDRLEEPVELEETDDERITVHTHTRTRCDEARKPASQQVNKRASEKAKR